MTIPLEVERLDATDESGSATRTEPRSFGDGSFGDGSIGDDVLDAPDARWIVTSDSGIRARCSLWWRRAPSVRGHRVGLIGNYAAVDDEASGRLLAHACHELRDRGCVLAVGPMDGTTWGDYRFVTRFGDHPRFWRERWNPPDGPRQFARIGFRPLARYFSALESPLSLHAAFSQRVARRFEARGVESRPIRESTFERDLTNVFRAARVAFRDNLLFSEPAEDSFLRQFGRLRELAPLELSWVAERDGRVIGFVFAAPDLCEQARGEPIRTVIVKSLAVVPRVGPAGLGQLLLARLRGRAIELGYSRAIHALVRDVGPLRRISRRYARPIRRYTLFAKRLMP